MLKNTHTHLHGKCGRGKTGVEDKMIIKAIKHPPFSFVYVVFDLLI